MVKKIIKKIWDFFCKVKVALSILLILAIISILGTVIPQNSNKLAYYQIPDNLLSFKSIYYIILNIWYFISNKLDLSNLYYSYWYLFLLFLLSMNLLVCTIDKFMPIWEMFFFPPKVDVQEDFLKSLKNFEIIECKLKIEKLSDLLKKYKFNIHKTDKILYGEKGKIGILGPTITHFSIIIIFIGSIISLTMGYKGYMEIVEGENEYEFYNKKTNKYEDLGFDVELNKFFIEYYPRKVSIKIKDLKNNTVNQYDVFVGDEFELKNREEYKVKVESFILDYKFPEDFSYKNRFPGNYNSAVKLSLFKNSNQVEQGLFFWGVPELQDFNADDLLVRLFTYWDQQIKDYKSELVIFENEKEVLRKTIEVNDPLSYKGITFFQTSFTLPDKDRPYYSTGLQVVNDPGVWTVYAGCFFIILGVILCFYFNYQRVWISIDLEKNMIIIGGLSKKNNFTFEQKFLKIVNEIKQMEKNYDNA